MPPSGPTCSRAFRTDLSLGLLEVTEGLWPTPFPQARDWGRQVCSPLLLGKPLRPP